MGLQDPAVNPWLRFISFYLFRGSCACHWPARPLLLGVHPGGLTLGPLIGGKHVPCHSRASGGWEKCLRGSDLGVCKARTVRESPRTPNKDQCSASFAWHSKYEKWRWMHRDPHHAKYIEQLSFKSQGEPTAKRHRIRCLASVLLDTSPIKWGKDQVGAIDSSKYGRAERSKHPRGE